MMSFATCDLCDTHEEKLADGSLIVFPPVFHPFGKRIAFSGPAATLKVFEDNVLVRAALETAGEGESWSLTAAQACAAPSLVAILVCSPKKTAGPEFSLMAASATQWKSINATSVCAHSQPTLSAAFAKVSAKSIFGSVSPVLLSIRATGFTLTPTASW